MDLNETIEKLFNLNEEVAVDTEITSNIGFYVGDICYALSNDIYYNVWGKADYEDGIYEVDGFKFAVAATLYGDGTYPSTDAKYEFAVDAGNLGIVPIELISKYSIPELKKLGAVIEKPGTAHLDVDNGYFEFDIADIYIDVNTGDFYDDDEDYDDEYYNYEDYDDEM